MAIQLIFPESESVYDDVIRLRTIRRSDLAFVRELYSNADNLMHTDELPHKEEDESRQYIDLELNRQAIQKGICWIIENVDNSIPIGIIRLKNLDYLNHSAVVGYYLSPEQQGKGFAGRALKLCCRCGFDRFGLHRIEAQVFIHHTSSIRVLEKCGFKREGQLRENFLINGRYEDSYIYGLIHDQSATRA